VKRMKVKQTLNVRLVVLTRLRSRIVEYDVKKFDNDIANVEGESEDNSRQFTRRSK
jgi:hypothetical protein